MTDLETLELQSEEKTPPPIHPARPKASAPPTPVLQPLALLSDTGAAHPYISKAKWLDLLRHIAIINPDGVLTAPVDFMTVQLALYSGLVMTTELATVRRAEKSRKAMEKIPIAAEQNNVLLTAAKAFNTAATCMSEVEPRMVNIAQAAADVVGAKTKQKMMPTRSRPKPFALPDRETQPMGDKMLPGKSPSSPIHN